MPYKITLLIVMILMTNSLAAQTHTIYSKTGKKVKYTKMIKTLNKADLIFIGESHNNPISHWLEMKVVKSMDVDNNITIGMEMFETDTQEALDQYLNAEIEQKEFEEQTRIWNNYSTDYAGIVNYAKARKIKVIASNIPRRYASMVYKNGFESIEVLIPEEKKWIAPLPIPYDGTLPGYVKMKGMFEGHAGDNFPKSQAIKDATMGHSIAMNFPDGGKFIHMNGSYHSDNFEGILWYIQQYRPQTKMATISTVIQENTSELKPEHLGLADFILVVDQDVTTSY